MHYLKYFYLVLFLVFSSCDTVDNTGIISGLSGNYISITFIGPSPNDAGVDIQAAGGYLKLTLEGSSGFSSELYVPDSLKTEYSSGHNFYRGYYLLKDSIIEIENQNFFLKELKWDKLTGQLESPDKPLRGGPTKVILRKIKSSI